MNRPEIVAIKKVVNLSPDVKTFTLGKNFSPTPGQFCMVWVPGTDEVPMSFSDLNAITVRKVGTATRELFKKKAGDKIGIRGPLGKGFRIAGKNVLAVGGGCGIAPLLFLKKKYGKRVRLVHGAKTKGELVLKKGADVCTDDGSLGFKGFVTAKVEEILGKEKFNQIVTCGPEKMMVKVLNLAKKHGIPCQASLERYMSCGIGICGKCVLDPGLRVCVDGPVFEDNELKGSSFGKYSRKSSGSKKWF